MTQRWSYLLSACAVVVATVLVAQTPAGLPQDKGPAKGKAKGGPAFRLEKGLPIDTRTPEKADDKPAFAGQTRAPYEPTTPPVVTTLTDKLTQPWSFAFLPDGKILITEKPGTMRTLAKDGTLSEPLKGVPAVSAISQVGLLDLALDPQFATNRRIFFTYSEPTGDMDSLIVVARAQLDANATALNGVTVIFRATPALPARTRGANQGGRIAIGRDGNLFVTIGDRSGSPPWDMAQKLDNYLGKMIRITPDGKPAPGNPFIGKAGALPEIWSYGHRSEEGLTIHPETGELWET
jgi:glucose/arabinose dehydrogenase